LGNAVFDILSGIALVSAALMITQRNALHSAAFFALTLLATAGIFLQLQSRILFTTQVVILVAAPTALFAFILLRLGVGISTEKSRVAGSLATLLVIMLVLGAESWLMFWSAKKMPLARLLAYGTLASPRPAPNARAVLGSLFGSYLLAAEIAMVLLVVAAVGAVLLTKQGAGSSDAID
jgi:NADH-quinone oxidoreductase subunit J